MKIDYTRYYRHWHDESEAHRAEMSRYFATFLGPWLPASKSTRILDVGCGMGFALHALRALGYTNVSGIDMDAGQVEAARCQNLAVEQCDDSIAYLNARQAAFDLVLCLDVIEHVPVNVQLPFAAALGNALEKASGRLICTVPNANSSLAARWRYGDWTHTSSFTEHSLDFLLFNAGFHDIRILPGELPRKFPSRPSFPAVASWLAWRFFRAMRRLELMAELGTHVGRTIPLSVNLMAIASR